MKLKDYLEELNKIVKEKPESLEWKVVYAKDDEGNGYQTVSYLPSYGSFDGEDFYDRYVEEALGEKVVCLN